jgi:invasion protein IalB
LTGKSVGGNCIASFVVFRETISIIKKGNKITIKKIIKPI